MKGKTGFSVRRYRMFHQGQDLKYFRVVVKETDLHVGIDRDGYRQGIEDEVERLVVRLRGDLETYIEMHPEFKTSLIPVMCLPHAPLIVRAMTQAAWLAGVGPMAAVAGAIAQEVGEFLGHRHNDVIVENGGDLFVKTSRERVVGIWAGDTPFQNKLGLKVRPEESSLGICSSSATIGPSLSFGKADVALVKAQDSTLADAVATALGNRVQGEDTLVEALRCALAVPGVKGALVIMKDKMAAQGEIELVRL